MTATFLIFLFYVLKSNPSLGFLPCVALIGLTDGFCGCLSTISTFSMELHKFDVRPSYIYGLTSLISGQLLGLLVLGSFSLSKGNVISPQCLSWANCLFNMHRIFYTEILHYLMLIDFCSPWRFFAHFSIPSYWRVEDLYNDKEKVLWKDLAQVWNWVLLLL